MRLSRTLTRYLSWQYLAGIGIVFIALATIAFTFDLVELLRRASTRQDVGFQLTLDMALLKLPSLALKLLPFAALFGAMLTLAKLTRSNELAVARAAGVSVWQFLLPGLLITAVLGGLSVTVVNPLASALVSRYEQLEAKYLRGRASLLAVSESGLWLRQTDFQGQSVVHALGISQQGSELADVIIFLYDGPDRFAGRIDAKMARLADGYWDLEKAVVTGPNRPAQFYDSYRMPTTLTLDQIQDSFASPETMSFWALPAFISTLEGSGFSALRHRLHWHVLLSTPLLLMAMILIAAIFSLRLSRRGGTGLLLSGGLLSGFLLFFASDVVQALGLSGSIPVVMAAWTPSIVTFLIGWTALLHLEDG